MEQPAVAARAAGRGDSRYPPESLLDACVDVVADEFHAGPAVDAAQGRFPGFPDLDLHPVNGRNNRPGAQGDHAPGGAHVVLGQRPGDFGGDVDAKMLQDLARQRIDRQPSGTCPPFLT